MTYIRIDPVEEMNAEGFAWIADAITGWAARAWGPKRIAVSIQNVWQPIETAPISRDVTSEPMLLYCPGITSWNRYVNASDILVGIWNGYTWESDVGDVDQGYESTGAYFERELLQPTHWMPLPEPPEAT